MNEQGYCIVQPTNEKLRQRLALKLEEYQGRVRGKGRPWEGQHPEKAHLLHESYRDACYKAYVLDALLKSDGSVDAWKLSRELHDRWKDAFNADDFSIACAVIEKYCGNLPNQPFIARGTGLPELPQTEE